MNSTPPVKVPFWIKLILPRARGLESNPLYIRLSGKGFMRRRWSGTGWPGEVDFRSTGPIIGRIGWLPFVVGGAGAMSLRVWGALLGLLGTLAAKLGSNPTIVDYVSGLGLSSFWSLALSCVGGTGLGCLLWGLMILLERLLGLDSVLQLRCFLGKADREAWGEELRLTGMTPVEFDDALCAALLEREIRWGGVLVLFWALFDSLIFASVIGAWSFLILGLLAPTIILEVTTLVLLRMAVEVWTCSRTKGGAVGEPRLNAQSGLALIGGAVLLHLPGWALATAYFNQLPYAPHSDLNSAFISLKCLQLLLLPPVAVGLPFSVIMLARHRGAVGRMLLNRMREG